MASLQFRVLHANPHARLIAQEALSAKANYIRGSDPARWIREAPLFGQVRYQEILPGVDLLFYGRNGYLEHDFLLSPGADPHRIQFALGGAESLRINSDGNLIASAAGEPVTLRRPQAYQMAASTRIEVPVSFHLEGDHISFEVGSYDKKLPLTIDPVLVFSTYLDGSYGDFPYSVTTDTTGNIYIGGHTNSSDFPLASAYSSSCSDCNGYQGDAYIAKLSPSGQLLFSTYIGGSSDEAINNIAIERSGNIIAVGETNSADFPKAGNYTNNASIGMFVLSLSATGTSLLQSEVLAGAVTSFGDYELGPYSLAVDSQNDIYVAGIADVYQFVTPYPTTPGSYGQGKYTSGEAIFASKFNSTGTLLYSTLIPAQNNNVTFMPTLGNLVVGPQGNAYIAGSAQVGLPVTDTTNQPTNGGQAGFLLELSPDATALTFSRYLPGADAVLGMAQATDSSLYLTGVTSQTTIPVSPNAYETAPSCQPHGTCSKGYVMHLSTDGSQVLAATYLDSFPQGSGTAFHAMALDGSNNVYLGGNTGSSTFPMVRPIVSFLDETDSFTSIGSVVAETSADLTKLLFSSYYNGDGAGSLLSSLTLWPSGQIIIAGSLYANTNFITTAGAYQTTPPPSPQAQTGYQHEFVAAIDPNVAAPSACFDNRFPNFPNTPAGQTASLVVNLTNCGDAPLSIASAVSSSSLVELLDSCPSLAPGDSCPLQLNYSPIDSSSFSGTIALNLNTAVSTQLLHVSGQGVAAKISAPANLSFGEAVAGTSQPIQMTVDVRNVGNAPLQISQTTATNDFSAVGSCPASLPAQYGFCPLTVNFLPSATGARSGSLVIYSNDPLQPQLTIPLTGLGLAQQPLPTLVSLSEQTQITSATDVLISLSGVDFTPQSVVRINGTPETTTFNSNADLQVSVPSALLSSVGELSITVFNPGPGGGESFAQPLSVYKTLLINPAALVSVPSRNMLYAAIPGYSTTNQNTILPIDPTTGTPGTPIPVGNDPRLITASSDGSYLYVALQQDNTIQRINLQTLAVDRTFPFAVDNLCSYCSGTPSATDIEAVPGHPDEVLLAQGELLTLFNDKGAVNTVPTSGSDVIPSFSSLAVAGNPQSVYALPFTDAQTPFFSVATLGTTGLQYTPYTGVNYGPTVATGDQVVSDGTLLYTSGGQVWDPTAQKQVGSFYTPTTTASSPYAYDPSLTLDPAGGALFALGDSEQSANLLLLAYNLKTLTLTGSLGFAETYPDSTDLVRWGTDGYAFLAAGTNLTDTELYVGVSSTIAAALASTNPAPLPIMISPAQGAAASADLTLTVTGSNFLPSSTVMFNGTGLVTTFVSSTELQAVILASLLEEQGQAQVTVKSPAPGGGTSTSLSFTVTAPAEVVPNITFNIGNQVFGDAPFQATATSTSPASITYSVVSGPATLAGNTVTLTGAGLVTLQASQAATQGYKAGSQTATFVAAKAGAQITWPSPTGISYGTALGSAQLNAAANLAGDFTYAPPAGTVLSAGSQTLSVSFAPKDTGDYSSASATTTLVVNKATPQITWATPAAVPAGTALTPTQLNASANVPGNFSYSPPAGTVLSPGTQTLSATFTPQDSSNYSTASAMVAIVVGKTAPQLSWTSPGPVTYGVALGAVQLNATSTAAGTITYTPASGTVLPAGSQTLTATFAPSDATTYSTATTTATLTVLPAPLSVTASNATRVFGAPNPGFTAMLSGIVNQDALTASASSPAVPASPVGTYVIHPSAVGNALGNYDVSTTNGTLTVTQASSTTALASSASSTTTGSPVTFTATVATTTSGTPTGSVQFVLNGSSILGTTPLTAGSATLSLALVAGMQSVTAVYSGDGNFTTSSSTAAAVSVLAPDFNVTVSPSTLSIKQGQTGTAVFTVTPLNGFNQPVSLQCGPLPSSVTCTFSPAVVTPSGSPVTSTLTVTAAAPGAAGVSAPASLFHTRRGFVVVAGMLLLPLAFRRRRRSLIRLLTLCALLALPLINGCGSASTPPQPVGGASVGTSQVLVTATSGAISGNAQHTANLTITITD